MTHDREPGGADAGAVGSSAADPGSARPGPVDSGTVGSGTVGSGAAAPGAPGRDGRQSAAQASDPQVAAALARLEELGTVPVAEHVAVFEDVHRRLTGVLGGLDEERTSGEGRS